MHKTLKVLLFLFFSGFSLNAQLTFNWVNQIGSSNSDYIFGSPPNEYTDHAYGNSIDDSGNVYVCGTFTDITDFDPSVATYLLDSDNELAAFIVKYDSVGNFIWANMIGKPWYPRRAYNVFVDQNQNVYVVGGQGNSFCIEKFNIDGVSQWVKGPSFGAITYVYSVATNSTGDVFIQGIYQGGSFGSFALPATSNWKTFLIKLDQSTGNFLFLKTLAGPANKASYSYDMKIDSEDNIYITGVHWGDIDFDPSPTDTYILSDRNPYILKLDSNAKFIWVKELHGSGSHHNFGNALDVDGGFIYLIGAFKSTMNFNPNLTPAANLTSSSSGSTPNPFLLKLDTSGNFIWVKRLSTFRSSPSTYTGGYLTSRKYRVTSKCGFSDAIVAYPKIVGDDHSILINRVDGNGNILFTSEVGGNEVVSPEAIFLKDNKLVLAGSFKGVADFDPGPGIQNKTSLGYYDGFVVSYNINVPYTSCCSGSPVGLITWTGLSDQDWHNCANWNPKVIPTNQSNVVIPFKPNQPIIYSGQGDCLDIDIQSNSGALLEIKTGALLEVHSP